MNEQPYFEKPGLGGVFQLDPTLVGRGKAEIKAYGWIADNRIVIALGEMGVDLMNYERSASKSALPFF